MITVDIQEKDPRVAQYLRTKGAQVKEEAITINGKEVGDFTNSGWDFLCERKSWKDYIGSITDKSLQKQMVKMCELFKGPKYLIFEGDWDAMLATITNKGLRALAETYPLRLQHVYGIAFVKCDDAEEVARFLINLDRYASGLTKDEDPWAGTHVKKTKDLRIRPLLSVPMFGETACKNLLNEYGNIMDSIEACGEDPNAVAKKVNRVGKAGAELLHNIFYSNSPVVDGKVAKKEEQTPEQKKKADDKRKAYFMKKNQYYQKKRTKV
jgi:ERCC4-type nuclease